MDEKQWEELATQIHQAMVDKGFHEQKRPEWKTFMLFENELHEAIEGIRKGKRADLDRFHASRAMESNDNYFRLYFDGCLKGTPEMEITDTYIRLLDYMGEVLTDNLWGDNNKNINYLDIFWSFYLQETMKTDEDLFGMTSTSLERRIRMMAKKYVPYGDVGHYESATGCAVVRAQLERLAKIMNFDLFEFITIKSRYNKLREYKHGKKY